MPVPFDGIRVAGTLWSAKSHQVKDFLARNRIPYQWLDIEVDSEARTLVESLEVEQRLLPAVFFPDGTHLIAPEILEVAEKVGLKTAASEPFYDLIIIGGGPAGLGAAVYGASEGLRTLMLERHSTGGQAGTSSRIENYLGFPKGLSGADLSRRATTQAERLGADVIIAGAGMFIALFANISGTSLIANVFSLLCIVAIGAVLYAIVTFALGMSEIKTLLKWILRKK